MSSSPEERALAAITEMVAAGETLTAAAVRRQAGVGQETAVRVLAEYRVSIRVDTSTVPAGVRSLWETQWKQALSHAARLHEDGATAAEAEVARAQEALEVTQIELSDQSKKTHQLGEELEALRQAHQAELDQLREQYEAELVAAASRVEQARQEAADAVQQHRELETATAVLQGQIEVLQAQAKDLWGKKK